MTADLWGESITSPHEIIQSVSFYFFLYKNQILVLPYKQSVQNMTFLKNSSMNGICAPLLLLPSYHEE